jgi:hypothetical protein
MKHAAKPQQPTSAGGKTVALNGSAIADELLLEEAALEEQTAQLEAKRQALLEQKEAAKRAEFDRKMSQYNELMSEAKAYRTEATKTDDEDTKLLLLKQAAELTSQANLVAANLGIEQPEDVPGESLEVSYDPWRWWIPFMQLGGLMAIILWCYHRFFDLKNEIVNLNKTQEAQINPYNMDSIQKLYFEKLAVGIDLFALLGILAVLAPSILLYLLPFLRSKQDFATDFKNELTPWQRILISSALLCSFLLYLALSHSVKP